MKELSGHKLNISPTDRIARCQCNAWQWPCGSDLPEAYAGHIKQEQEREAAMIAYSETYKPPSRLAKVGQLAILFAAFACVMFTVLHFIG